MYQDRLFSTMASKNFSKLFYQIKLRIMCKFLNSRGYKSDGTKVVLVNSYNTIGITTTYLLKKSNLFSEICMQDSKYVSNIKGIIADMNYINTPPLVTYCIGDNSIADALQDASIVILLENESNNKNKHRLPKPCYLSRECVTPIEKASADINEKFLENAELCANVAELYAKICPTALFAVAIPPINSILPLMCTVAVNMNHYVDVRKILGFISADVNKVNLVWAERTGMKRDSVNIPVIGGTTENTLIPLFSQVHFPTLPKELTEDEYKKFTEEARNRVTKAPLATAASIAKFIISLGMLIKGNEMKETLYIASNTFPETNYIAGSTQLGQAGVQYMLPFPKLSDYEKLLLDSLAFYLKVDIKRGEDFAVKYLKKVKIRMDK